MADLERRWHVKRVGPHKHDVGGVDCNVGAGSNRDAEVGLGERGGVVYAVSDHRNLAARTLELGDFGCLVTREHLRKHGVDSELLADPASGRHVVAGKHHDLDACLVERRDRRGRARSHRVRDRDHRSGLTVHGDEDDRVPVGCERVVTRTQRAQLNSFALHQPCVSDSDPVTVDPGQRAVTRYVLELLGGDHGDLVAICALHDRLRKGMLGGALNGRDEAQQSGLVDSVGLDLCDLRLAFRQRSGLVQDDGLDARRGFERGRVLEQDAALSPEAGADHDRGRGGQTESVGAGDHDNGDREQHGGAERPIAEHEPGAQRQHPTDQRYEDQPEGGAVGEPLTGRLRALRFLHELDDLRERGVTSDFRGTHSQGTVHVDRGTGYLVAGVLVHRQALARDHRLVDLAVAILDDPVGGDLGARSDDHQVADEHLSRGDLELAAVTLDEGLRRREIEQRPDRVVRATTSAHLEPVPQEHERREHGGRLVEGLPPTRQGHDQRVEPAGADRDSDEHHHVQRPCAQGANRPGEEDRARVEDDRQAQQQLPDVLAHPKRR